MGVLAGRTECRGLAGDGEGAGRDYEEHLLLNQRYNQSNRFSLLALYGQLSRFDALETLLTRPEWADDATTE